ncbi:MAG: YihY family inner membrane protein [Chlorobium sp.]|uniref:YihY family inner membrane protein n=1 Tax=Chlorobium sp. TaxID=1095 RepID=UPI001DFFDC81|nr:YihY family inner membrane protein [Chlorobium sp.]MBN1278424.1 YihY family inner membrane protein [Chlorobiaceae bacterium]MCF8215715.1 YihY family inner membrane protein [Chlorobium sp.]MCF8270551.1 YihY family inner membrane protein [Chlorobium sp.]MCF8286924.1 YihY family inner membrane protein [Chlorobium sp.]MCF8290520.1 YihY family inner membrane protein [Chlorobium sp.]
MAQQSEPRISGLAGVPVYLRRLLSLFWRNLQRSRIFISAGSLAFQTILSMVPFLAVTLSILKVFPFFASLNRFIVEFILLNFVPSSGDTFRFHVEEFIAKTSTVSLIGGVLLFVIALSLISTIDHTLNGIWKVRSSRKPMQAFTIYWTALTLGPLLIGSSLAASSYVWFTIFAEGPLRELKMRFISFLPFMNSLAAFFLLYSLVPNRKVKLLHAFSGAFAAAVLFELSKKWFVFYVSRFATFEHIYGALSAVPMLFFWVYLAWVVVLTGAELASSMGFMQQEEERAPVSVSFLQGLYPVLSVLDAVRSARQSGQFLHAGNVGEVSGLKEALKASTVSAFVDIMLQAGVLQETTDGRLVEGFDFNSTPLYELYDRIPRDCADFGFSSVSPEQRMAVLAEIERKAETCLKKSMDMPVASLLQYTNSEHS